MWPIAKKKKKMLAAEPKEENLSERSSIEWLVAKLLSAVSKMVSLFIFIRVRALHFAIHTSFFPTGPCYISADKCKFV